MYTASAIFLYNDWLRFAENGWTLACAEIEEKRDRYVVLLDFVNRGAASDLTFCDGEHVVGTQKPLAECAILRYCEHTCTIRRPNPFIHTIGMTLECDSLERTIGSPHLGRLII